jgi:hypothetical protein
LTVTSVKVALEAGVEAHAEPVKCNGLFSDSQEKSRKPKRVIENDVPRVYSSGEEDRSCCTECAKLNLMSRATTERFQCITIIDGPTTDAPDSATCMFVAATTLYYYGCTAPSWALAAFSVS